MKTSKQAHPCIHAQCYTPVTLPGSRKYFVYRFLLYNKVVNLSYIILLQESVGGFYLQAVASTHIVNESYHKSYRCPLGEIKFHETSLFIQLFMTS